MPDRPRQDRRTALSSRLSVQAQKRRRTVARTLAFLEPLEERVLMTRLAITGDLQSGSALQTESTMMKGWNPDAIISLGDNVHGEPTVDDTVGQYFHSYVYPYNGSFGAGSTTGNKFWSVVGNHDYEDHGIQDYLNFFTFPGNELYYTTTVGNVGLFFVDSNPEQPDGNTATSIQGQWLKSALAASTAKWKLVMFHFPAYTSGTEGDHDFMQWPFQQWGASAVLSAHDHMYERLSIGGFPYFVDGLGGATIVPPQTVHSGSQVRYSADFGAMQLNSTDTTLNFQFINDSGTVIDNFTLTASASVPTATLIPQGATWKYLDNGTNQGTAWEASGFNDSTWKSGPAQLGYGDPETTTVGYGPDANNKYITTYFRTSFNVSNPAQITALNLQLLRDDGAVVYLNGTEVFRSNMPTGTINYQTLASTTVGGTDETTFFPGTANPSLLVAGTNVVAVEIHQSVVDSSDISFDMSLVGTLAVAPTAPGNLAAAGVATNQIKLTWADNSSNETGFIIERSLDGSTGWTLATTTAANLTTYTDTVTPGALYYYRVRATNSGSDSANTSVAHSWPLTGPPASPSPSGVTVSALPPILDWADALNATSYDVYWGSALLGNVTASQYTGAIPASADGAQTWHVVAKNADNSNTGPTWTFTLDTRPPTAAYDNQTPTTGAATLDFTVTYADITSALDAATFDNNDITVTGPNGYSAAASFVSNAGNVVTYRIAAPGGIWDLTDDGLYTITQNANEVKDIAGNAIPAGTIGTFTAAGAFAWISGSTLNVQFDGSATPLTLDTSGGDITVTRDTTTLSFSGVVSIDAIGTSNADNLRLGAAVTQPLTLGGAAGSYSIEVLGGTHTFTSDLSPSSHNVALTIDSGATATFASPQHLSNLVIDGSAILAAGGASTIFTAGLTVAGSLNINDNALFLDDSGATPIGAATAGVYDGITGLVQSGRNGGAWDGNGIITGMSAASGSNPLTTLGVAAASEALGITGAQTALWNGQTVGATTVLIKYTYLGDANLDGIINGDDYFAIDTGYSAQAAGYSQGDFNLDGRVDADDYFLIDSHYGKAATPLAGSLAVQNVAAAEIPAMTSAKTLFSDATIASAYDRLNESDDLV